VSSAEELHGETGTAPEPLAPPWHTAALIALMLAVAVTGTWLSVHGGAARARGEHPASRIGGVYLPLVVVNVALLAYVCVVGRPRSALRDLLGRPWHTRMRAFTDVALALLGCVTIDTVEWAFARLRGTARNVTVLQILPDSTSERLVWILVAVTVGFCEEVVYRGYLQKQLVAFSGSAPLGILCQGPLFGVAHGEQGLASASRLATYGMALGGLAAWRGSLMPGILCHVGLDLVSGLGPSR
jgi:membrane protease YdiL (CAAX protease family)